MPSKAEWSIDPALTLAKSSAPMVRRRRIIPWRRGLLGVGGQGGGGLVGHVVFLDVFGVGSWPGWWISDDVEGCKIRSSSLRFVVFFGMLSLASVFDHVVL